MIELQRLAPAAAMAAAICLASCDDGLIRPPAPAGPASVRLAASLSLSAGGPAEAYQKVDQLSVRFSAGGEERAAQVVPFSPGEAATVVSLQVPLEDVIETVDIEVELRAANQALFRGSSSAQLTAGGTSELEVSIVPVVSGVTCAGLPFQVAVFNAPRRLTAAALFASGDTVTGVTFGWSSASPAIATINQAGDVTGRQDGSAQVTCTYQGFSSSRVVQVFAVVASVQVLPARDTAVAGTTVTFTATRRDSLGNNIPGPRPTTWSSSNNAIATVSASGVATAVGPGTATITATSGNASGTATLLVLAPPIARTISGTPTGSGAILVGGVNPQAQATQAWFEWGTSSTLVNAQRTTTQQLAGGTSELPLTATLGNLAPGVTYYFRMAASNPSGTAYGQILSFRANSPPVATTQVATLAGLTATLRGTVNPGGLATTVWFEYATNPSLTGLSTTPAQNIGAGTSDVAVNAPLTGLAGGRTYYFRVAASNQLGTDAGNILSFVAPLPPTVTTQGPINVTGTAAVFQALVNPNGNGTVAWFEWGLGTSPSSFIRTTVQVIGSGTSAVIVSQPIGGLQRGTTYSYRAVAGNVADTTRGSLRAFTTLSQPGVITQPSYYYDFGQGTYSYLWGTITPQPVDTEVWFEYSATSPTLGTYASTPVNIIPVGGGVEGTFDFYDVVPGVVYFRAVARHAGGTTRGAILQTQDAYAGFQVSEKRASVPRSPGGR